MTMTTNDVKKAVLYSAAPPDEKQRAGFITFLTKKYGEEIDGKSFNRKRDEGAILPCTGFNK